MTCKILGFLSLQAAMGYRLLHWGPLIALSIIFSITAATVVCHLQWWPLKTAGAFADAFVFSLWNVLTLYNFFKAAFVGPGYVPLNWKPVSFIRLQSSHTKKII